MYSLWLNRSALVPRQTRWGKLRDVIDAEGDLNRIYQVSYALFTREFLQQLSTDPETPALWGRCTPPAESPVKSEQFDSSRLHAAISNLELERFIGQRLLRDTDCASMAVSLEVRVPLLDHRLIEEASRIEQRRRFFPLGKKMLLREMALTKLDPKVFDRPKSGFVLPFERWMKNSLRDRIACMFADRQLAESVGLQPDAPLRLHRAFEAGAPGLYWSRVWALYVLMWWAKQYNASL
jgi:asparagine synthase (glutamine-hydrolysing)